MYVKDDNCCITRNSITQYNFRKSNLFKFFSATYLFKRRAIVLNNIVIFQLINRMRIRKTLSKTLNVM